MNKKHYSRLLKPPSRSFFLFGPRGTGKSTWLDQVYPDAHVIDLLDESLYQSYLADVGRFSAELRALKPGHLVVIDEVQRLPNLLNEVHRFIEKHHLWFALCGSSARKLKQSGTNLLAGRAIRKLMHPFVPEELGRDFLLDDALRFGTLPVVFGSEERKETLKSYVQLYLKEEIQAEALVRNLPGFARFLPVAALFHGQTLNVASLARDAGVSRTTVAGYLEILEDTLLAFRLEGYEAKLRVRERRHPKLYWCDSGLVRAVKGLFGEPDQQEKGHLFEGFLAVLLRAYQSYSDLFDDWYYWCPASARNIEVDFLLKKDGEFIAIEVKAKDRYSNRDARGLRAISDLPDLKRRILVYMGTRAGVLPDGVEILPFTEFVSEIQNKTLFP